MRARAPAHRPAPAPAWRGGGAARPRALPRGLRFAGGGDRREQGGEARTLLRERGRLSVRGRNCAGATARAAGTVGREGRAPLLVARVDGVPPVAVLPPAHAPPGAATPPPQTGHKALLKDSMEAGILIAPHGQTDGQTDGRTDRQTNGFVEGTH